MFTTKPFRHSKIKKVFDPKIKGKKSRDYLPH